MSLLTFLRTLISGPSPETMAGQLRRPSGWLARRVGQRMNAANRVLYDATWRAIDLQLGHSVLEIGYGNGLFFPDLLKKADGLRVFGLDFSEAMHQEATANNRALIGSGRLQLHHGDSAAMPFADNSFDRIYCINVVYFWDDPAAHLREVKRVLRSGGTFTATIRTKSTMQVMPFTRYGFAMYEQADWEAVLARNGFKLLRAERLDEPPIDFEGRTYRPGSLVLVATPA